MQIGCISVHPFLFNEKFFLQKPLILLDLFNITKKKLKKSSEKLFTFKKVVYICKVIKNENKMKTQIELLEENIKRLEYAILTAFTFQAGYIENCKSAINSYKKQIEKLKSIN